ncbi:MAG: sigma-70 family RNA polymerase sigma factor [Firmicutes bacterium]|nr:sigma-70 family RNA polymerase sigma factor [Bacillota bacterium]
MSSFVFDTYGDPFDELQPGSRLSAGRFLAMTDGDSDQEVLDALDRLDSMGVLLDISDLQPEKGSGQTAKRLEREEKLIQKKISLRELDPNDPLRLFLTEVAEMDENRDGLEALLYAGDEASLAKAAECCLPMVAELAGELTGKGVLLMDLVQEGSLGLWQALASWQGEPAEPFLSAGIQRAMIRSVVMQARADGVGTRLRRQVEAYQNADRELLHTLGRNPTIEETAEKMGISAELAGSLEKMLRDARSTARENTAEERNADEDLAVDATAYYQSRQRVTELLEDLDRLDARLLSLRFGLDTGKPMTVEEAAGKLGISPEEAAAREQKAMILLRNQEDTE